MVALVGRHCSIININFETMTSLIEKDIKRLTKEELKVFLIEKESALLFLSKNKLNKPMQKILKYEIKKIKANL
jgi:hypothetical protein